MFCTSEIFEYPHLTFNKKNFDYTITILNSLSTHTNSNSHCVLKKQL